MTFDWATAFSFVAAAGSLVAIYQNWIASRRPNPVIEIRLETIAGREPWQKVWIIVRNHDRASARVTKLSIKTLTRGRLLPLHLSHANDGFSSAGMAQTFHSADTLRSIAIDLQVGPGGQATGVGTPGANVSFWAVGQNLSSAASLRVHWQRADR